MKAAALSLAALLMLGSAAQAQGDPVAGTWKLKGKVQSFGFTLTCRFTRSGDSLGGTCFDGGTNKPHPIKSGKITGDRVVWTYGSDFMGQKFDVTYSGTVRGATMSGGVDAAGRKGEFSGAR
ncbi:hypothetical protein GVN21_12290 [Caulobacter sp. SLTY]|uniref:hypothetical protein n=1 Tax=Caulobacter sp. SLTY TaxID=2683262 RepID=UPI0014125224|nr:hypothetical protein [Caulobacter sp. SLTY]NBB16139.1 hypothetical protein [Caulobacter sp. SLTY]